MAFLEKYFPKDVREKKGIKFLELKQGNSTMADYVAKFEELSKCWIYDKDKRARVAHFKGDVGPMKGKQSRGQSRSMYLKCGCLGHLTRECVDKEVTCFNCGKQCHIARNCMLSKKKSSSAGRSVQSFQDLRESLCS
ncbi:hypothetical protein CR513_53185, partial [Mucuna pruriens]